MTDSFQIPSLPVTATTAGAAVINSLITNGTALFQNPVAGAINLATGQIPGIASSLTSLTSNLSAALGSESSILPQLSSLSSGVSSLSSGLGSLLDHTNSLIFGGGSSILSGGLMANLQQMLSGTSIKKLLYGFDAIPFPTNCTQLSQFFGSLLGAGASMASGAMSQLTGVGSFINQATSLIGKGIGALTAGLGGLMSQATSLLSGISSVANQMISQISSELGAFASLLNTAMNFITAHTIASNFMNACSLPLMSAVGSPELQNALADVFVASNPAASATNYPTNGNVYNTQGTTVIPSTTAVENILKASLTPDPNSGSKSPGLNVATNATTASLGVVAGFDSPSLIKVPIATEQPFVDTVASNTTNSPGVISGSTIGVKPGQVGKIPTKTNKSGRC